MSNFVSEVLANVTPLADPINLWNKTGIGNGMTPDEWATINLMDAIVASKPLKSLFETAMLGSNVAQVLRNQSLNGTPINRKTSVSGAIGASDVLSIPGLATGLIDVSMVTSAAVSAVMSVTNREVQELWEKTLMEPNIEGVPISTSLFTTSRNIDVGEQVMIVQSSSQKSYWTDNAVPRLKEWTIEGYITTSLTIDSRYLIKPSLTLQLKFLDTCAASRRPVLFKDNRGVFTWAQIVSLQTTEDPTYNNAVKVNINLKEYKPYEVENKNSQTIFAVAAGAS